MDFSNIKAGSFLKADGGFLILSIADLTIQTWQTLQRVLQYKRLEIQAVDNSTIGTLTLLKPEPIEPNVKVILIGDQRSYYSLYFNDENFKKIFKVLAEFNYETELNSQMIEYYAKFIARVCVNDNLPHCDRSGVAAILEWAVSKTETQNKISLIFSDVGDITREAAYYATQVNSLLITREFVEKAVENRRRRNSVYDEKVKTRILNNTILIDTSGSRVGQINGLTVSSTGLESFGQPVRITATAGVGNEGIVTIEQEAELSGKILNKGSMIVYGFFLDRFARTKTFTLTSHVAFEQTYGGVEGDSASAAAVYAIMSAISEVPVNQFLAITGSMNQKGDIQPIGGVNEKIEGFFDICALRGLDGNHAVVIPKQNVPDLMLKAEIIQAVKEQKFAIYPIEKIEDAIPLFFGLEAGSVEADGSFTSDSLFAKIDTKLQEFAKHFQESIKASNN
jgi:ATP-dependent Lon protease